MDSDRRRDLRETTIRVREDPLCAMGHVAPRSCLVVIAGLEAGSSVTVSSKPLLIGRDDDCGLTLRDDGVSRQHVQARLLADGRLELRDLGSSNGTFVGGRLVANAAVAPGQKVMLGLNSVVRFEIQDGYDQAYHRQMYDARVRDWLTGTHNRRHFDEQLPVELSHSRRQQRPMSVLLLDVDHFKLVNDAHGHAVGDSVLVALGQTMRSVLRAEDLLARIGGEEFAVLARDTGYLGACRLAARLREDVSRMRMLHGDGEEPVAVTISIGAVSIAPESTATMSDVLAAADGNLYAAKAAGRNVEEVSRLGNSVDAASARRRVMHTYRFADQHAAHAGKRVGQPKTER